MARRAIMTEVRLHVVWIGRAVERRLMATVAVGRRAAVPAGVAARAGHGSVFAGEGEGRRRMIETRWSPTGGGVADRAVMAESRLHVIWISRPIECRLVTAIAIAGRSRESAGMATDTGSSGVLACERK